MKLLAAFITGAGNPKDWNGFKPFIEGIRDERPTEIAVLGGQWDNPDSLRFIAQQINSHEKVLLGGESHGAWRAIQVAAGKYGKVDEVDVLLTCDPVPPMDEGWEAAALPEVPDSVVVAQCFYGVLDPFVGKPFEDDPRASNTLLFGVGHSDFPTAPQVEKFVRDSIDTLLS